MQESIRNGSVDAEAGRNDAVVSTVSARYTVTEGVGAMAITSQRNRKLDAALARYIEENPYKPGVANARLVESGMAIWAFAGALEAAGSDPERVAHDYELSREQVDAAIAYYQHHKDVIDDRRAANRLTATL
jgi:uncharacterized protein (DUF433 family)